MNRPRLKRFVLTVSLVLAAVITTGAWILTRNTPASRIVAELRERTPGELLRYAQLRLSGHPTLEAIFLPPLSWARDRIERKIADLPPATLLQGAHPEDLPQQQQYAQQYGTLGEPLESAPGSITPATATVLVNNEGDLLKALAGAVAGDVIEILPGHYTLRNNVWLNRAGTPRQPITVRAAKLGEVLIEFEAVEGFVLTQPFWLFENLHIRGACKIQGDCDHAFHIVGNAHSTVLRNNVIQDFNAHIKINGHNGRFPDNGLIQHNHLFNTAPRTTYKPVVLIDLVAASGWHVSDNLIADFITPSDRNPSYGIYMKGGGRDGRIERNLVVCQLRMQHLAGLRVGISLGGGLTGKPFRRDPVRDSEHDNGLIANNIVAHCNDFGIDVHASRSASVVHNTLINTYGISVRGTGAFARIANNMVEGSISARKNGTLETSQNLLHSLNNYFRDPDRFDFTWIATPKQMPPPSLQQDFCGTQRQTIDAPGALSTQSRCNMFGEPVSLRNPQ